MFCREKQVEGEKFIIFFYFLVKSNEIKLIELDNGGEMNVDK